MQAILRNIFTVINLILLQTMVGYTQNPVVQTIYTADPAPMVYKDTVFLYTGHDEDNSTWFTMKDWKVFSSTDMVNWTYRGTPLSLYSFSWAKENAWAGQCIERNGKFYWYVPVTSRDGETTIGVAIADHPAGPFRDALGKPLIAPHPGYIDPTVFIDNDGQAYLHWGNPGLWYVKLNEDMVSYSGNIVEIPLTEDSFGKRTGDPKRATLYEEAPWIYKRNKRYYLIYAAGGIPEYLAYSTSDNPMSGWQYQGKIMPTEGRSFTNHPGVIDFKGNSYLFYHNGALPGGSGFTRSVSVEQFEFNVDGSFPNIAMSRGISQAVRNLDPFSRKEAETIAWEKGVETASSKNGIYVTSINNGDYIKVRSVDFAKGAKSFSTSVANSEGGTIELHLDTLDGPLIGTLSIPPSKVANQWQLLKTKTKGAKGIHDLYLLFKGDTSVELFDFDYWLFGK